MRTIGGSESGAASPSALGLALEIGGRGLHLTQVAAWSAPGISDAPGPRAHLLLLVARLWRATEDWVVLAPDLSKRELMDLSRHTERVRMVARARTGLDLAQLSTEVTSLVDCLPVDRTPEVVRVLLAQVKTEVVRLRAQATVDAELAALQRALAPGSETPVKGPQTATLSSDGASRRARVLPVLALIVIALLCLLAMRAPQHLFESSQDGSLVDMKSARPATTGSH